MKCITLASCNVYVMNCITLPLAGLYDILPFNLCHNVAACWILYCITLDSVPQIQTSV